MRRAGVQARDWLAPALLYTLALIAIAMIGGGWLALGRVDPLLAVPGAGWAAVVAVWALRGRASARPLAISAGCAALVLGAVQTVDGMGGLRLAEWAIASTALVAAALLAGAMATGGARLAGNRRWAQRLVMVVALPLLAVGWTSLAWPMVTDAYRIGGLTDDSVRLVWLTALPIAGPDTSSLRLDESQGERDRLDEPIQLALHRTTRATRLVSVDATALTNADVLLLAHPPALDPAQLVAIDDWVRGGGRVVVLADGLSSWPPPWPLGDPRNPPVTSLLGPLLAHWGVELDAPARLAESRTTIVDSGQRLELLSAGRFRRVKPGCVLRASGFIGDCRVGRGSAVLVADADMLQSTLWAGGSGGGTSIDWRSGNMLWLLDKLDASDATQRGYSLARPSWSRSRSALVPPVTAQRN